MKRLFILSVLTLATPLSFSPAAFAVEADAKYPEARPYDQLTDSEEVDAAISMSIDGSYSTNKPIIVVMGANWCHDSRALAGWFKTPRFQKMLDEKYHSVIYVDAGNPQRKGKARNQFVIKEAGGKPQKNTPYVMVLSAREGKLLNRDDARSWRNAASRSGDDIYNYFDEQGWLTDK